MRSFYNKIILLGFIILFSNYALVLAQSDDLEWPIIAKNTTIRYIKSIKNSADFGIKKSTWNKLRQKVTGAPDNSNSFSAQGLAISTDGCLAFSEPEISQIQIFDPGRNAVKIIKAIEKEKLLSPVDVEFDKEQNIYISDSGLKKIFTLNPKYKLIRQFGINHEFIRPTGIAINDELQTIYVVDTAQNCIFAYGTNGELKFKFGKRGSNLGEFNFPTYICLDREGKIYVTDTFNFRIQIFDATGNPLFMFGQAGQSNGSFAQPKGIAVDTYQNIYVSDTLLGCIHVFDSRGNFQTSIGNNNKIDNLFSLPTDIAISNDNSIYIADSYKYHIHELKLFNK